MNHRPRIYYTETQRALMWDRWRGRRHHPIVEFCAPAWALPKITCQLSHLRVVRRIEIDALHFFQNFAITLRLFGDALPFRVRRECPNIDSQSLLTDRYLPAVSSITEKGTDYLYWVISGPIRTF